MGKKADANRQQRWMRRGRQAQVARSEFERMTRRWQAADRYAEIAVVALTSGLVGKSGRKAGRHAVG